MLKNKLSIKIMRVLQYFVASVLLVSAIGKLLDNRGFAQIIETYQIFPVEIILPLGLLMSLTELGLSLWIFSGRKLHLAALSSTILNTGFIVWLFTAMYRGLELGNCGCFGVFLARPLGWVTIIEDVVMITASLALYFLAKKLANPKREHK